jgi:tetratricopeptide (TPR) repeat protein
MRPVLAGLALIVCACAPQAPPLPPQPSFEAAWAREQVDAAYQAAAASPRDSGAAGSLGMILETYGLHEAGAACFRRAGALAPEDWRWAFCLGLSQAAMGDPAAAAASYREAARLNPADAWTRIRLADLLLGQGEALEAESLYRKALELEPDSIEALYALGARLGAAGRCGEALPHLERATRLAPQFGAAYDQMARCEDELGAARAAGARAQFRRYRNIKPPTESALVREIEDLNRDPSILRAQARVLADAGHFREAAQKLDLAVEIDPAHEDSWTLMILVAAERGMWAQALTAYERALALNSASASAHYGYGVALVKMGAFDDAVKTLHAALDADPNRTAARIELGKALEGLGRLDEALAAYEAALQADPDERIASFYAGRNLLKAEKPARALPYLQKAVEAIDGQTPRMMRVLAGAYSRVGRFDDAVRTGEQALELAHEFGDRQTENALVGELAALREGKKL